MKHKLQVLGIDAGGTMTDTFLINEQGDFVVGKAQSTPEDESVGFIQSSRDALKYWQTKPASEFPNLVSGVYSGTAMLNRLLSRKGGRVGLLVTAGQEDYLVLERGLQTYSGYSYSDRLHIQTHVHNEPLVPKSRIRGIPERIDLFGEVVIPLYENAARKAIYSLLEEDIESLCISFLHSYRNPVHELTVKEIAEEILYEKKKDIPIFISAKLYPMRGDFARVNTVLVEAYAADPSRQQMNKVEDICKENGGKFDLRVMASHGGTISIRANEMARTLISGPIGGVVGAQYLGQALKIKNLVCTDIGGTSFDLALITEHDYQIKLNPEIARFVLALPQVQIDSIGAGTGSFVRVNPTNNRIELGPDSAGARIGMCYPDGGLDTPSVTDCHVVLGIINPDNFLGRDVVLDVDRAIQAIEEFVARPLGLDVYKAAAGVVEILENNLRNQVYATIVGKGYSPANYTLISYGGGGPVHVAGYTESMEFEDILIPTWAAGFSAYGCSCAEFEYRNDKSLDLPLNLGASEGEKTGLLALINSTAMALKMGIQEEFANSSIAADAIEYDLLFRILYKGQLNELEVRARKNTFEDFSDIETLIDDFETLYGKVYSLSAKSPELGFLITTCVVSGRTNTQKPILPRKKLQDEVPSQSAKKGQRKVYWQGKFLEADIWDMEKLSAGNKIHGLAIIESPATTFVVPPCRQADLDKHLIFHLRSSEKKQGI